MPFVIRASASARRAAPQFGVRGEKAVVEISAGKLQFSIEADVLKTYTPTPLAKGVSIKNTANRACFTKIGIADIYPLFAIFANMLFPAVLDVRALTKTHLTRLLLRYLHKRHPVGFTLSPAATGVENWLIHQAH
jgi:hypothetical protein